MMATQQAYSSANAIPRAVEDEQSDHADAVRNAVDGAYLDWPNEAGVSAVPFVLASIGLYDSVLGNDVHNHTPKQLFWGKFACPDYKTVRLLIDDRQQFANLDEHRGPIELPVRGNIPSWAAGTLFRTGPGANTVEDTPNGTLHISHWFDGLAHTHRFDIIAGEDGVGTKVWYSSRRQCDDFIEHARKNGGRDIITFGQRADPCIGLFGKIMSTWMVSDTRRGTKKAENIGVTVQLDVPGLPSAAKGGALPQKTVWLGTDCHLLREVDGRTLEPIGLARQDDLHPQLDGELSCAHVQRCPTTGDYINVNIKAGLPATYKIFRVSASTGETEILATISRLDVPMAYIHSFFLSQHFVVLRLPSSHISLWGLSILWNRNMLDAMEPFDQIKKNKWFIIDRLRGRGVVAEFETEAAFFFHTVNCFDKMYLDAQDDVEKWSISCDTIEYPNMNILRGLYYDVVLNQAGKARTVWGTERRATDTLPRLTRWKFTLPLHHRIPPQSPRSPVGMLQYLAKTVAARVRERAEELGRNILQKAQRIVVVLGVVPAMVLSVFRPRPRFHQVPMKDSPDEIGNDRRIYEGAGSTMKDQRAMLAPKSTSAIVIPSPHVGELPTINPAYHTRPYRYVYSLAMSGRSTLVDTIVKTNLVSRAVLQWNNPLGHTPGEAIFVKRPGGVKEDDGVLLSVVLDGFSSKSYLICLDARTMCEIGRAEMDFAVGFGFHGVHAPKLPIATTSEEESDEGDQT